MCSLVIHAAKCFNLYLSLQIIITSGITIVDANGAKGIV